MTSATCQTTTLTKKCDNRPPPYILSKITKAQKVSKNHQKDHVGHSLYELADDMIAILKIRPPLD